MFKYFFPCLYKVFLVQNKCFLCSWYIICLLFEFNFNYSNDHLRCSYTIFPCSHECFSCSWYVISLFSKFDTNCSSDLLPSSYGVSFCSNNYFPCSKFTICLCLKFIIDCSNDIFLVNKWFYLVHISVFLVRGLLHFCVWISLLNV